MFTAAEILAANSRFSLSTRRRLSGPGFRTFLNIADLWMLTEDQRLALLGISSPSTYSKWVKEAREEHREIVLNVKVLTRISAVLGIHQALGMLEIPESEAGSWLRASQRSAPFSGSPLALITSGSLEGLLWVRRFLEADPRRIASAGEFILGTINAPRPRKLGLATLIAIIKGAVADREWAVHVQSLFEEAGIAPIHDLVLAGAVSFQELDATRRRWGIEHGKTADWVSEMAALEMGRPPSHDDRDPRFAP